MKLLTPSLFLFAFIGISVSSQAQWIRQYPMAKLADVNDIVMQSDGFGFAVGDDDMILRWNPATKTWQLATDPDLGWSFFAVDYLNNTLGTFMAAGGTGLLLSQDGGHSYEQIAGAPTGIKDVHILPDTHVMVIASSGAYLYDGQSWTNLNAPVSSGIINGYILDDQHIWLFTAGSSPVMYYTSNGGTNWNMNTDIPRPDVVRFYDTNYGMSLDGRHVYRSVDGGQSWTNVSNNVIHNSVYAIDFGSAPGIVAAATYNGVPTISVDSGLTWTQHDMGLINTRSYAISVINNSAWVGNELSSIGYSEDGGLTWTESSGPKRRILYDIFFLNHDIGFSVGSEGGILRTMNGGQQWEDVSLPENRTLYAIYGNAANDLWTSGNLRIYHSADTASTWQERGVFLGGNINDIVAVNANRVLACSSSGIIYRTDDAGVTWDTVYQTNNQIRSLARIDNQHYMAAGYSGMILRSADQGETWNALTPPEAGNQYEQSFFYNNEGWLVTSSFKKTMWHTTNMGNSWDTLTLPIERFWDGVYFISSDTGVVVGRSNAEGRTYITFDGGHSWQSGYITTYPFYGVSGLHNPNGTAWIHGLGSDIEILPNCNMLPVINNFNGNTSPCEKDTIIYTITSQDVDHFSWLFPPGWNVVGSSDNDTVKVIAGRNSGMISVTGTNSCGYSSPISVLAGAIILPTLSDLHGIQDPCESELSTYSVAGNEVQDYTWSFPGPDWQVFGPDGQNEIMVFAGESSGLISVVGSNSCGDSGPQNLSVTAKLRPRLTGLGGDNAPCQGSITGYEALTEYADEVTWSLPSDWQILGDPASASITVNIGKESGLVSAVAKNDCGESATSEIPVNVKAVPEVALSFDPDLNTLSVSVVGIGYQWYLDGQEINLAIADTYMPVTNGDYYCIVNFDNGCQGISDTLTVLQVAVTPVGHDKTYAVWPSPARDQIRVKGLAEGDAYRIYDHAGVLMLEGSFEQPILDISALAPGVYAVMIRSGQNAYTTHFVIQR